MGDGLLLDAFLVDRNTVLSIANIFFQGEIDTVVFSGIV